MTSRQTAHNARVKANGGKRATFTLTPEAVAALAQLKARGARSDAAAVNAAVLITDLLHSGNPAGARMMLRDLLVRGEA